MHHLPAVLQVLSDLSTRPTSPHCGSLSAIQGTDHIAFVRTGELRFLCATRSMALERMYQVQNGHSIRLDSSGCSAQPAQDTSMKFCTKPRIRPLLDWDSRASGILFPI